MQLLLGVEEGAEELDRVLGGDHHLAGPAQPEVGQAVTVWSNTVSTIFGFILIMSAHCVCVLCVLIKFRN